MHKDLAWTQAKDLIGWDTTVCTTNIPEREERREAEGEDRSGEGDERGKDRQILGSLFPANFLEKFRIGRLRVLHPLAIVDQELGDLWMLLSGQKSCLSRQRDGCESE
jgi:hypothetical protein